MFLLLVPSLRLVELEIAAIVLRVGELLSNKLKTCTGHAHNTEECY